MELKVIPVNNIQKLIKFNLIKGKIKFCYSILRVLKGIIITQGKCRKLFIDKYHN